jgi:glycosyltransferase involved in cell wall biosynthesis
MEPLVTTVIPTYRRPAFLRRAVTSALKQTFKDLVVCIYDNASGDETEEIARSLMREDSRVRYHRHPENIGSLKNFEFGLNQVQTKYFSLLSDDDILLPGFYEAAVAALEKTEGTSPAAQAVGPVVRVNERAEIFRQRPDYFPVGTYAPPDGALTMMRTGRPTWVGILFRTSMARELGGFDHAAGLNIEGDFILKLATKHPYVVIGEPSGIFTLQAPAEHRDGDRNYLLYYKADEHWFGKIRNEYGLPKEQSREICDIIWRQHAKSLMRAGAQWALQGKFDEAQEAYDLLDRDRYSKRHRVLYAIKASKYFPPLRLFNRISRAISKSKPYLWYRSRKHRKTHAKYQRHVDYMKTL